VRLHSACLTGDCLGSTALPLRGTASARSGAARRPRRRIILDLTREGRGLGLANKMRTYLLQDDGLDTFDANTTLAFDDDERDYGIAAGMLGC